MSLINKSVVKFAVGAVVVGSALSSSVQAIPFAYTEMEAGYEVAEGQTEKAKQSNHDTDKAKEAKCGEEINGSALYMG
ncbi:hypothetical protein [Shewanella youngdeokensis]|uniref:Uncharacterized protein n=1 Tax=Shewanella youngdeokensis TaxID=2999068 RepID=A0ABZ0K1T2_9GAMM|nr:hypothetical protein RGE70_06505 [Shewanella sp. DAU334]